MNKILLIALVLGSQVSYTAHEINTGSNIANLMRVGGFILGATGLALNITGAKDLFTDPEISIQTECVTMETGAVMFVAGTSMFIYGMMKRRDFVNPDQVTIPAATVIQSPMHQIVARPFSENNV